MAKKFPKEVYVRWRDGGTGPDYLDAAETEDGMVEMGEKIQVGLYRLVETQEFEATVTVRKKK